MLNRILYVLIFCSLYIPSSDIFASELRVIYPNVNDLGEHNFGYAALQLALKKSGMPFTLELSDASMTNERIRREIMNGYLSIADFGTSPDYEKELLPIYIPIDLGLNGWRVFLVTHQNKSNFANINSLDELKSFVAGQGSGWADTAVLKKSGIPVVTATNFKSLMKMLNSNRFDYFPLGANEAWSLLDSYKTYAPDVEVEEHLLLVYPFGRLFFVNPNNVALHDAVYDGLKRAFADGSFWQLFKAHPSNTALFRLANLSQRTRIEIENPNMSERFMNIPFNYYFHTSMLDKISVPNELND